MIASFKVVKLMTCHTTESTKLSLWRYCLLSKSQLTAAEQMYLRALGGYEKTLGPDHNSTLTAVNNPGRLYRAQGKLDEAEQMHKRALHPAALLANVHVTAPDP